MTRSSTFPVGAQRLCSPSSTQHLLLALVAKRRYLLLADLMHSHMANHLEVLAMRWSIAHIYTLWPLFAFFRAEQLSVV